MAAISTKPVLPAKAATATASAKSHKGFAHSAWAFLSDFAGVSGAKGYLGVLYALGAALLDGISVSFLIPLLGVLFGSAAIPRWLGAVTKALFSFAGVHSQLGRLGLLIAVFGVLVALRAVFVAARDMTSFELQLRFIEQQRLRLTTGLTASRWDFIARLRHARMTHLMSGDIHRLGTGVQYTLLGAGAAIMLLVQFAVAAILSPALAMVVGLVFFFVGFCLLVVFVCVWAFCG